MINDNCSMTSVSIVGAGRLGGALAIALAEKGYSIKNLISRSKAKTEKVAGFIHPPPQILTIEETNILSASDIVLIAVPDPEIESVAERLAACDFKTGMVFLHTSGSRSSESLKKIGEQGGSVGSLHPLVSVSEAESGWRKFAGAFFCVEGDRKAVKVGKQIAADLGGESFQLETKYKTLYHAAAVMAAGHFVALFEVAAKTLVECGMSERDARKILLPLVGSVIENLRTQTPSEALTGTFARADAQTMRRHLAALQSGEDENVLRVYAALGLTSVNLASKQAANSQALAEMRRSLQEVLRK